MVKDRLAMRWTKGGKGGTHEYVELYRELEVIATTVVNVRNLLANLLQARLSVVCKGQDRRHAIDIFKDTKLKPYGVWST